MQFSNTILQTIRRDKRTGHVAKAKSLDCIKFTELTAREVKILLTNNHSQFASAVAKQQLLADKQLFDPFKYFGSPSAHTFEDAYKYHHPRLQAMFSAHPQIERKTPTRIVLKGSLGNRIEQASPTPRAKGIEQSKRTLGKSPKSYVKQNKQNFMRLNLNNMQKMRVKLKLNKK